MRYRIPFLLAALLALPAAAQQTPWYVGVAAGQSRAGNALVRDREATIAISDAPGMQSSADLKDNVAKVFLGYRLSPVFALEAHWSDLGEQRIDTAFDVPFGLTGRGGVITTREMKGWGLDLLAGTEVLPGLAIHAKVGAFRAQGESTSTISGDTVFGDGTPGNFRSKSANETVLKVGLGAQYAFTEKLSARLEWERFPDLGTKLEPGNTNATGEADHDAWWLGIVFRF